VANFFFPSQDKQVHKKHLEQALEKQLAIEKPKKTLVIKRWFPDFQQEKKP
jgi:hypothetical protein